MATNPKFEAALFDLDGVLTSTAALHARSWKLVFDNVLDEPFDAQDDYLAYVDGKPRFDGVRDMMRAPRHRARRLGHPRDRGPQAGARGARTRDRAR